jgi:hypothetical protein
VKVIRSLERRLERLLDGVAGRVFSGRIHPAEMASRLSREADFARFEHESGPATANLFLIGVNPKDLTTDPGTLEQSLASEVSEYVREEGLRIEGPVAVEIRPDKAVAAGSIQVHVEVRPGTGQPWARLVGNGLSSDVGRIRSIVGRSQDVDVVIPIENMSRRHAVIWTEGGRSWIKDLGSVNGTSVDGLSVGADPMMLESGSMITFAESNFRFLEI